LNLDFLTIKKTLAEYLSLQTKDINCSLPSIDDNLLAIIDPVKTMELKDNPRIEKILFLVMETKLMKIISLLKISILTILWKILNQ
jgi:hypothetical protein